MIDHSGAASEPTFWVGLGASAGGLEALRGVVRGLPVDAGATFVVAQHMAPHHRSMLSEIIGRETTMPVRDVTDKLAPEPNTIYITPPNFNVMVEQGMVHLFEPSREPAAPKPSVDVLLQSLAKELGERAIGIVLSGTGSDGAEGIRAIRSAGGIAIAQDELTAKYSSMPVNAIETGCVDLIMSPEEIGAQFTKIVQLPRDLDALRGAALDNDRLTTLMQLLMDQTKVNFRHYKTATFQRRVERRMAARGVLDFDDYVRIAQSTPAEVDMLFQDLLISVTSFFRDPAEFDAVARHIAEIVRDKAGEAIRVWVPGTATGEEAYTIAILFAEALGGIRALEKAHLQIFATDIDSNAIETARRGFYPETSMDVIAPKLVERYFDEAPTGYLVKKVVREKIVFSLHNIAQDPPFLNLDMISCRNLLIYFQSSLQAQVFARFHYALVPKGLLFLGKSETTSASESLFRMASPDKHIFFQRPTRDRKPLRDPVYGPRTTVQQPRTPSRASVDHRALAVATAQFESLVAALGPNAMLMDGDLRVRRAFGDLKRYVGLNPGNVDTSAMSLLNEPYRQDIRAAVPATIRKKVPYRGVARRIEGSPETRERIDIYPVDMGPDDEIHALIIFTTWTEAAATTEMAEPMPREWRGQVEELSRELEIARTNLQQTVEELETSNEELQALNEELQSSNEELQSTNEELETSNEELQSTNEELTTVNEELQVNSQQLRIVNQSLHSILDNVAVPMLVVDRDLNITNASSDAEAYFGVSPDLVLPHISRCTLPEGYPSLTNVVSTALERGKRVDVGISQNDQSATLTVVPHYSAGQELIGAIVVLADNTAELRRTRDELQLIFDNLPAGIMVRGADGRILKANRTTSDIMLAGDGGSIEGRNVREFYDEDTSARILGDDARVLADGAPLVDQIVPVSFQDGRAVTLRLSRFCAEDADTGDKAIYSLSQDVTLQQEMVSALELSQQRLDQAVRASMVGLWDWNVASDTLFWSDRFLEIVGIDADEFGGKQADFLALLHPDDLERVAAARDGHLTNRTPYEIGFRLRHSDGEYRWVEAFGQATWDVDGTPLRFVGTVADVTQRKENYWELRERNQQLAMASSLSGFGYWKIDLTDDSIIWSDQIFVIHGIDADQYKPELASVLDFYHPDDSDRVRRMIGDAIDNGTPFEFVARIVRADGEVRIIRSMGQRDTAQDGSDGAVFGVLIDITDKEREEQLRLTLDELSRSNEELNRFSYVCSHDMKEPVRMIETMSELLLDPRGGEDPETRDELLKRIVSNTRRLRGIIDSLLAYSRIDAKVESANVDLNEVLADVRETLSIMVEEKGASIRISDMPILRGARVHYTQLFQNLLGNALKFGGDKAPEIRVRARQAGRNWTITVDDNGPGVPKEHRTQVFSLFSRLHLHDEVDGTGLGLSICQRIVSQYGGTIVCEDSELGGAKFEITLPAGVNDE